MNQDEFSFIAGLHGDELTPYFALCELGIIPTLGNPRAAFMRQRFVDRDLNGSFGVPSNDTESIRAQALLAALPTDRPVIDFHTFSCKSPPFSIIVDPKLLPLARRLGIRRVVLMTYDIKSGHSLIGHRPGVSVEVGQHDSKEAYLATQEVVRHLNSGRSFEVELYQVTDVIKEPGEYENFCVHESGFIPILSGERAYNHYGLKAHKVDE